LVQFSIAKVTIFYFGAKGISAFCEPAGGIVLPAAALAKAYIKYAWPIP